MWEYDGIVWLAHACMPMSLKHWNNIRGRNPIVYLFSLSVYSGMDSQEE